MVVKLLSRVWRVAAEEVMPLASRRALADLANQLPSYAFHSARTALFRAAGAQIGAHSLIQGPMRVTGVDNPCAYLTIGDDTLITGGLHLDLGAPVSIGNRVRIGHDVTILTVSHAVGPPRLRAGTSFFAEVVIEDGAWIASRALILPGVTIGAGAIVAAGAVVSRNVPKHSLVAGVPARLIRELTDDADVEERVPDGVWAVRH